MSEIAFLPAGRVAGLIRHGEIGRLERLERYSARAEQHNRALNAIFRSAAFSLAFGSGSLGSQGGSQDDAWN